MPKNRFRTFFCQSCPPGAAMRGFSIGLILMAVTLIAALGTAVLLMSRTDTGDNNMEGGKTMATALIGQARNLKAGIASMTANGTPINTITFDTTATTGLFNPTTGGTEMQTPSPSLMRTAGNTWVWKVNGSGNPVVKLYNVGITGNADYVAVLSDISSFACYGINMVLHQTFSAPILSAGVLADWNTAGTAIDLSASNSGTQGWSDGCFEDASQTGYVFVVTVRPQ